MLHCNYSKHKEMFFHIVKTAIYNERFLFSFFLFFLNEARIKWNHSKLCYYNNNNLGFSADRLVRHYLPKVVSALPKLCYYIVIETSQPMPSSAEEPNIESMTKSTPSKSCLIDPLISPRTILFTANSPLMADLDPTKIKPSISGIAKTAPTAMGYESGRVTLTSLKHIFVTNNRQSTNKIYDSKQCQNCSGNGPHHKYRIWIWSFAQCCSCGEKFLDDFSWGFIVTYGLNHVPEVI